MKKLLDMAEQLSERYLISEVMELPETGRGSGLLSAFENGWKIHVGTDWRSRAGTPGVQRIH